MLDKKLKLSALLLFVLVFGLPELKAQEAIPVSGGNASGYGGSVSYSVGQVIYTANTGTSGSEAQGVQQPFEISVVTGNVDTKGINLACTVFPNPATDHVLLKVENGLSDDLSYLLYDASGKILEKKEVRGNETTIQMGMLVPASYFLKIVKTEHASSAVVKTFKIVKK